MSGAIAASLLWLWCMSPFWIGMAGRPYYRREFRFVKWATLAVPALIWAHALLAAL